MVKPADRKLIDNYMINTYQLSERKACDSVGISRTGFRYQSAPHPQDDQTLSDRLKALASQYPRYGYLLLHNLLKQEGLVINKKRAYQLYSAENLQVRTKNRKKLTHPRLVMDLPHAVNQRWSMDFVVDQLVAFSITGQQVARFLSLLIEQRSKPRGITCDNGTGFISKADLLVE